MIVEGSTPVLVGEVLADLRVGEDFAVDEGVEVEPAESFAVREIGASMHPPRLDTNRQVLLSLSILSLISVLRAAE